MQDILISFPFFMVPARLVEDNVNQMKLKKSAQVRNLICLYEFSISSLLLSSNKKRDSVNRGYKSNEKKPFFRTSHMALG